MVFCGILNFFFKRVCSNRVCLLVWKETNTTVSCVLYKYVWPSTKLHNKIYHLLIILGTNIFLPFVAIDVEWSTSHLCCMKFACKRATSNFGEGGRELEVCLRFTSFKRVSDRFQDTVKTQHCHVSNRKKYSSIYIQV